MTKHLPKLSLIRYAYLTYRQRSNIKKVAVINGGRMNEQDFQKYSAISNEMMAMKK